MARFVIAVLAAVLLLNIVRCEEPTLQQIEASIKFIDNIEEFKLRNADLKLMPLSRSVDLSRQQINYTVGSRLSGDRLVAQNSNNQSWPTLQDVQLVLTYPQSGSGAVVTYVVVSVSQSSTLGRAYIVGGGVGQRRIQIVVEGKSTNYFNYTAQVYGY